MDNNDDNSNEKKIFEDFKNCNSKRRQRESIEEENFGARYRRAKIEKDGIFKIEENNSLEPINSYDNYEKSKKSTSNLYDSSNKNDVLNIIWKITAQRETLLEEDSCIEFSENYFSQRNDGWYFHIDHINRGKNSSGLMRVSIKCINEVPRYSEDSYLANIFSSINYEVEVNFQFINHKTQNYTIKNLSYNEVESKEIQIPSDFYNQATNSLYSSTRSTKIPEKSEDEVIIILELSIRKIFPSLMNNKEITGFTGIVNEAATCYMNSMLQTLNIFGYFKRAVFQIPTTDEDYHSVALSLQRLFYDLMIDTNPVTTNRLVKSFGWGREQMLIQHDVQEFNILLSDIMEKKMKGTPGEGTFNKLFAGVLNNYIQCMNVDYKSNKEEKFTDLQLTVKGCKDIYDSLNSYTEEEILDNADKYYAEGYGKQKAKKGIRFVKFPSVLVIQLKRFEYNAKKEAMIKINDHFEFYEQLDLERYLINASKDDISEDNKYTLHSVVVHQGNANSGHYYAYIKPTLQDFWIQYNDEIVKPADKYEVFKNNYGGNYKSYKHKSKGEIALNTNSYESNAYILVYIKNSERKLILNPVNKIDIPFTLRNRFDSEKNEERKLQLKKMRMTDNLNVILITKENVMNADNQHSRLGIITPYADLDKSPPLIMNKYSRLLINFPRNLTLAHFLQFIHNETNIPIGLMKLYEYDSGNTSLDSIIKCRSDFELIPIEEERLKKSFNELTNNFKKHIISFFLFINDETDKLKVLKSNSSQSNEEYKLDDKLVLISKEINKFIFNGNSDSNFSLFENFDSKDVLSEYTNDKNSKIIFIKEFNQSTGTFKITKITQINLASIKDFQAFSDKLKSNLMYSNKNKFDFLIECTSLPELNDRTYILNRENYQHILDKASSLIIIPVPKIENQLVLTKVEEMYDTIYIDLYCPNRKSYTKNKLALNLKKCYDESSLKSSLLREIKTKNNFQNFIELSKHYFVDQFKCVTKVEEQFLQHLLTEDNIELLQERDSSPKFFQACKETPLIKYLNQVDCRIDLNLNLFSRQAIPDAYPHTISLFDINNNKICIITVIFPKKIKRCREVIDYLYDTVLTNTEFYSEINEKENFFFILQNPNENYIYQMLIDNNSEMLKYEGNAEKIEYRLQPFRNEVVECFQDPNCTKTFVTFVLNGGGLGVKLDPIILYVKKGMKLLELKFFISEQLKNISSNAVLNNQNYVLKFYSSRIENNKIRKDINLQQSKEEDSIENILKDERIYNILTEIIVRNEKLKN